MAFRADADDVFKIGDTVWVDVTYGDAITTSVGATALTIYIGTDTASSYRTANCSLQGNRTVLQCGYTVVEGDSGAPGIPATTRSLTGGQGLNDLEFEGTDIGDLAARVVVDGVRIGIDTLTVQGQSLADTTRTAYKAGDTITVRVTFDELTTPSGVGSFGVTLDLDDSDRAMTRTTVADTDTQTYVEFSYIVAADDNASRIRVTYTDTAGLKDKAGNVGLRSGAPTLVTASEVTGVKTVIDNRQPRIVSVTAGSEALYMVGDPIELTVLFSEDVLVTGTPILDVTVGTTSTTGAATCSVPSATEAARSMICSLLVLENWNDANGVSIPRNPLRLGSGAQITDPNGHAIDFNFSGAQLSSQKVDGIKPWIKTLTLTVPTLKVAAQVKIDVTFSEDVKLAADQTAHPVPVFQIDGTDVPADDIEYVGGTSKKWQYRYSLDADDIGSSGDEPVFSIADPGTGSVLTTAAVVDVAGNELSARIDTKLPIRTQKTVPSSTADTVKPTVDGVRIDSEKKAFRYDDSTPDTIRFVVLFSEPVALPSGVSLSIRVGSVNRDVTTVALRSGGHELEFSYPVVSGDSGTISVSGLKIDDTAGSEGMLKDVAGNGYTAAPRPSSSPDEMLKYATKTLRTGSVSGYSVDNTAPRVTKAELLRTPAPGAVAESDGKRFYGLRNFIRAKLTISERVAVSGDAALDTVILDTTIDSAAGGCASMALKLISTDGKQLTFECQVIATDSAVGGLGLEGLTGTVVTDVAGNQLDTGTTDLLVAQSTHLVDGGLSGEQEGVPPLNDPNTPAQPQTVTPARTFSVSGSRPSSGYYGSDDTLTITVPLNPPVSFTSRPQLILDIGDDSERIRANQSIPAAGVYVRELTFSYDVDADHEDLDGIEAELSGNFTVEGDQRVPGTMRITISPPILVDAKAPEIESVEITSNPGTDDTYVTDDNILITVRFSEPVKRATTADPSLPIDVGGRPKRATLQSPSATADAINTFVFRYPVAAGDNDADGISIPALTATSFGTTLEDAAGHEADIDFAALADDEDHLVDTRGPSVTEIAVSSDSDDRTIGLGETVTITVTFDEEVNVPTSGADQPALAFMIGGVARDASYADGDNSTALVFEYPVEAGDSGAISVGAGALSGEIEDGPGNPASNTSPTAIAGYVVDAKPPEAAAARITSSPATGNTYIAGETITFAVDFGETVTVTESEEGPRLVLMVGDKRRFAYYQRGSGTDTLTFGYEVLGHDVDADGIEVTNKGQPWLQYVGATITDDNGLEPVLLSVPLRFASVKVDAVPATVTRAPNVVSKPGDDGTYIVGDRIEVAVNFGKAVNVTGTPQLAISVGDARRAASYFRGSGSDTLVFAYTVRTGDLDEDGISAAADSLTRNAGTITDTNGMRVVIRHPAMPAQAGHLVDGVPAKIANALPLSDPGPDMTYITGDMIRVGVVFGEPVVVKGVPQIMLTIGDGSGTAGYMTGSGTNTLVFGYTVQAGDLDEDGISAVANALSLNGGSIKDTNGLDVEIRHDPVPDLEGHKVDGVAAEVTGLAIASNPGADETYITGDPIHVAVTFSKEVTVDTMNGAPGLTLDVGAKGAMAGYASGSGSMTLTFEYIVQAGDSDADGVSVAMDSLALNGGAIMDANGLDVVMGHMALADQAGHMVDAVAATITGIDVMSDPGEDMTYIVGDPIHLAVSFDKAVTVDGAPNLAVDIGGASKMAGYAGASDPMTHTFEYIVQAGDSDDNGIAVAMDSLALNGGTIMDGNGLSAAREHAALADQDGHMVDGVAATIESVEISSTPASGDAYLFGESVEVTVTFDEAITVDGTPMLMLTVGSDMMDAMCAAGSDATMLACTYEVMPGDFDADGVSIAAGELTGGMVMDVPGNPAALGHGALADDENHKVFAAAPESVGSIPNMSLRAGGESATVDLSAVFSGYQVTYSASSSDPNVASASVAGTMLTVTSRGEGSATITATAQNVAGDASVTFGVSVTTDPIEKAVLSDALAAIGRSMLSSTANVIGSRFDLASQGASMAVGGQRFSPQAFKGDLATLWQGDDLLARNGWNDQDRYHGGLTTERMFSGTAFNMPLNATGSGGGTSFAIWGAGDLASFEGEPDGGMYDGSATSGYLGVDARGYGWLAGVSISRSGAEADYDFSGEVSGSGTLETSVTSFHPYAQIDVGEDSEIWVIGGFGSGEADLMRSHVGSTSETSDLSVSMAIGGLKRALDMQFAGAALSLRGDAGFLSLETDSGSQAVDGLAASVNRLRIGLEAAWENGGTTPFAEVAGRFDGGDGQTGGGIELAGGLRIASAQSGFGLEAKGRILAMHSGEGYSESGFSVTASFEPGTAGRGITFRLSPRWGGSADSTDLFWDEYGSMQDANRYGFREAQTWGMDAALGYGFDLRSIPGLVTPFSRVDVTGSDDQRFRVGVRYGLLQGILSSSQFEVSAEHVDGERYRAPETRVLLTGQARF